MGAEGRGWGREAGGEVACEEGREGGRSLLIYTSYARQIMFVNVCKREKARGSVI